MTEELQEEKRDANGKCIGAKLIVATLEGTGYGLSNNGNLFIFYTLQISLHDHFKYLFCSIKYSNFF